MTQERDYAGAVKRFLTSPLGLFKLWGAIGAAFLLWMIVSAAFTGRDNLPQTPHISENLLTGEMRKFTLTALPTKAPDIRFEGKAGPVRLGEKRGKVVLVNLWASWCPPCLKELPHLDALQAKFPETGFEVIAIASEKDGIAKGEVVWRKLGLTSLDHYADPTQSLSFALGGGKSLPLSILYDENGNEIGRLAGAADWSGPEAVRLIETATGIPAR